MHDPVIGTIPPPPRPKPPPVVVAAVALTLTGGGATPARRVSQVTAASSQLPSREWRAGCGAAKDRACAAGTMTMSKTRATRTTEKLRVRRMILSSQKDQLHISVGVAGFAGAHDRLHRLSLLHQLHQPSEPGQSSKCDGVGGAWQGGGTSEPLERAARLGLPAPPPLAERGPR